MIIVTGRARFGQLYDNIFRPHAAGRQRAQAGFRPAASCEDAVRTDIDEPFSGPAAGRHAGQHDIEAEPVEFKQAPAGFRRGEQVGRLGQHAGRRPPDQSFMRKDPPVSQLDDRLIHGRQAPVLQNGPQFRRQRIPRQPVRQPVRRRRHQGSL